MSMTLLNSLSKSEADKEIRTTAANQLGRGLLCNRSTSDCGNVLELIASITSPHGCFTSAFRKLQVHLDSHHFKLSEEKKIVAEIDKLNRSKRVVG